MAICLLVSSFQVKINITRNAREADEACLPGELSIEFMQKMSTFFAAYCVEKCIDREENYILTKVFSVCVSICLSVCLDSVTKDYLRIK